MPHKQILFMDLPNPKRARALQVAKSLGYRLALASKNLPEASRPFVDRWIQVDPEDNQSLRACLQREHSLDPFHGVISFLDRYVEPMALISKDLGIPGNPLEAAKATRNKAFMRDLLEIHQVPRPRFRRVTTLKELQDAEVHVRLPFIFKPVGGASSKAIFKATSRAELPRVFQLMMDTANPEKDSIFRENTGQYLAEEFMVGREYSVEGVAQDGAYPIAGITEKWTTSDDFTETQHLFPARISAHEEQQMRAVTEAALRAIGFRVGGFHVELMLTSDGPKIVEINGRLGGDFITTHLVQLGRGIEILGEAIKAAVGDPIDLSPKYEKSSSVKFLIAQQEGQIQSWKGFESARQSAGIVDILIDREVGSLVRLPPKKYGEFRLAAVISQAESSDEALASVALAESQLSVEMAPLGDEPGQETNEKTQGV